MGIELYKMDNMDYWVDEPFADFVYSDMIYENDDFSWIDQYWHMTKPNGIFAVHTDHKLHSDVDVYLRSMRHATFINDIITIQRWGGVPKDRFPMKHDYILVFCKGKDWHWDASKIQVPKQMTNASFNPSGRTTKTPDACWEDLGNFSTTSGERLKTPDGKNIQWQKPLKQLRRLMTPFLRKGDTVVDPFMGTGTSGEVALELECNYVGIEYEQVPFKIAQTRLGENYE